MENSIPLFSIIIPCYNQGSFLNDCLNSILIQNFSNWEAIIVNDGSGDNTILISKSYSDKDSRIKTLSQVNQGLSAARNSGMREASGSFLLFLDADDWLESNCLSTYQYQINSLPNAKIFRCGYAYWDKPKGRRYHAHSPKEDGKIWPEVLTKNIGPCHSILILRSFAEKLGGFDISLKSCEDRDFWIRAGKMGADIISIRDVLVAYRYVAYSMSRNAVIMYESLTKVTDRGMSIDSRLPLHAVHNVEFQCNRSYVQKYYLIKVLGILIHQVKVQQAIQLYFKENKKWEFEISISDWSNLSSYLTWRYFLGEKESKEIINSMSPLLDSFFLSIGYSRSASKMLIKLVLLPQYKVLNHYRYGSLAGALFNRLNFIKFDLLTK